MNRERAALPATGRSDDEDAAAVLAVLTALAAVRPDVTQPLDRSLWGTPAHRLGALAAGPHGWWASGMPR